MKILFLDHDGVLCPDRMNESDYAIDFINQWDCTPFHKVAVENLNKVIDATDCEIVVSSDWRQHYSIGEMKGIYTANGVHKHPIAFTGKVSLPMKNYTSNDVSEPYGVFYERKLEEERCEEISIWRTQHKIVDRYCIVDDMPLFEDNHIQNHFVHVDYMYGLTQTDKVECIIETLNRDG